MIPANVEKNVANRMGINTSVGWAAPIWARYTNMEIGISVRPLVFSTRNMIIGFDAVTFRSWNWLSLISPASFLTFNFSFFTSSSCSIAFRPKGVAALSSPSIFAAIFIKILPVTGCPLGISGNSLANTGDNSRASTLTTPPFSPIFMMPSQSDSTPVSPSEISKAVFDDENVESIIAGNTSKSPKNTSFTTAMTNAMMKNAIHI